MWIAVVGVPNRRLVRRDHLELSATVPDHSGHAGPFCAITWSFEELGIVDTMPCTRPALVVLSDRRAEELLACADHWQDALGRSDGAIRAVRLV